MTVIFQKIISYDEKLNMAGDMHACMQGQRCAKHPWRVLGCALLAMLICSLGIFCFRVETDPQRLWVGSNSQAAIEKAAYEVEHA